MFYGDDENDNPMMMPGMGGRRGGGNGATVDELGVAYDLPAEQRRALRAAA